MSGTPREVPKGLSDSHVLRLFKCAVKDDDLLVDAIVEKLYGTMRAFDAGRAKRTVELIVDRDTAAASKLGALLDDRRSFCMRCRLRVPKLAFSGRRRADDFGWRLY